jgi:hypothetical protein
MFLVLLVLTGSGSGDRNDWAATRRAMRIIKCFAKEGWGIVYTIV